MEEQAASRLHTICVARYQRRTAPLVTTAEWTDGDLGLAPVPFSLNDALASDRGGAASEV